MCDKDYVCNLCEASVKKAKKELNEDPDERKGAVTALRKWVDREPWITAPSDDRFLLSFLRCGKFSQLKARERLGNFMAFPDLAPYLMGGDPCEEKRLEVLRKTGAYLILPGRDEEGRTIVLTRYGNLDTSGKSYSFDDILQAAIPLFHSLMFFDENFQVNGAVFLMDATGLTIQLISFIGMDKMKRQNEFTNKALPMRIKSLVYYNVGPVFESLMTVFRPMMPEKMKKRIKLHGHMSSVYKEFDMPLLPEEYLPDDYDGPSAGSCEKIIEDNIQEYLMDPARREFLKELYSGKYQSDIRQRDKMDEPQASFRKLNVS